MNKKQNKDLVSFFPDSLDFSTIFEASHVILYAYNFSSKKFEYISPSAEKMVGFELEALYNFTLEEIIERTHPDDVELFRKVVCGLEEEQFGYDSPVEMEARWMTSEGKYLWFKTNLSLISKNGCKYFIACAIETEEQKQTMRQLDNTRERFKNITEQSLAGIIIIQDRRIVYANQAYANAVGFTREEISQWTNEDSLAMIHPDDRETFVDSIISCYEKDFGVLTQFEFRGLNRNGDVAWISFSAGKINYLGSPAIEGVMIDITERKNAEETLRVSEERFQAILNSMTDTSFFMLNTELKVVFIQIPDELEVKYGIKANNLSGQIHIPELIEPNRQRFRNACEYVMESGSTFRFESNLSMPNGVFEYDFTLSPLHDKAGKIVNIVVFAQDITEKKQAEELAHFRVRFENVLTNMSAYFINLPASNIDNGVNETLKAVCEFLGVDRGYIYNLAEDHKKAIATHQWHSENGYQLDKNSIEVEIDEIPWLGEKIFNFENVYVPDTKEIKETGEMYNCTIPEEDVRSFIAVPMIYNVRVMGFMAFESIHETKGWPQEIISLIKLAAEILMNVLKRKEAEVQLRKSEEQLRAIFESTDDCIIVWSVDDLILYANQAFLDLAKLKLEDVINCSTETVMQNNRPVFDEWHERVHEIIKSGESAHFRDHGVSHRGEYWADSTLSPLRDSEGNIFAVAILYRNITDTEQIKNELDNYREKMIRTEQLASLGVLGATVAHELNQPLTVLKLLLQQTNRALKKIKDKENVPFSKIKESLLELDNASRIVNRFRTFARKMPRESIQDIDVKKIMEKILASLANSAKKAGLEIKTEGFSGLPHIEANIGELEQIFFILIQNAIQAIKPNKKNTLKISAEVSGEFINLIFEDTCQGISKEHLDKVFEPFFTTKPATEGTGLGLSIIKQLLESRGGDIKVGSEPGVGTCFKVKIPVKQ